MKFQYRYLPHTVRPFMNERVWEEVIILDPYCNVHLKRVLTQYVFVWAELHFNNKVYSRKFTPCMQEY